MDAVTIFSVSVFFILFLKWILKRREVFSTFEKLGIPGPKPSFFIGNLADGLKNPYFEADWVDKHGPIFGFFFGTKPVLAVADPEFLKIIQVKEAEIFHARNTIVPLATVPARTFGNSVAVIGGPRWKENRDSITPAYTTSKFKSMNSLLNKELDEAIVKIAKFAENQQSFDLTKIYTPLFGKTSLQISFGVKINDGESKAAQLMFDSLNEAFPAKIEDPNIFLSLCLPEVENLMCSFRIIRQSIKKAFNYKSSEFVTEMCDAAIKARKAEKTENYTDVLQFLINSVRKKMKSTSGKIDESAYSEKLHMQEDDILSNSFYLAVATYNLIRIISLYGTYELAKSPRVQEKLRKEILEVNGDEKHISYDNLNKMQYLDQVFSEAIRLHPTVPLFSTRIAEEDYYYKGQLIPKGMTVYVPQVGMQRSAVNFPNPNDFIPERFNDKSKIDPYIYQPFGIGPRHCLGMRLTQYFGKLTLARMIQSFNLSVDPKSKEVRPEIGFVVYRPKDPIILTASAV